MKKLPFTLLFLFFILFTSAQSWKWGVQGNRTDFTEGWNIAIDKSANVFLTGEYNDSLAFGPYVFKGNVHDCFIVKYDSSGNLKWANSPRSTDYSWGLSVATDNSGGVYMAGYFQDSLIAGTYKLSSNGSAAPFLVKYNANGTVLWARQGISSTLSYATSTTTDIKGNVFVTGYFLDTLTFGTYKLYSDGQSNLFIVKYDSSGNLLWATQSVVLTTLTNIDNYASVATDLQGNVYVADGFYGKLGFGSYILNDSLGEDIFLAKYDTGGNVLWAEQTTVPSLKSWGVGYSVIADASDNVYLTGQTKDTISFGSITLSTSQLNKVELFLAKYDGNGNPLWVKESVSNSPFGWKGYSLAIDSAKNVYMAAGSQNLTTPVAVISFGTDTFQIGNTPSDPALIVKFDSNGNALCGSIINSGGDDQNGVAADPNGKYIYIGGDLASSTIFASDTIGPPIHDGTEYPFIARWSPCVKDVETTSKEIRNNQNAISIFPNPCSTTLSIDFETQPNLSSIQLMDITGRVLLTSTLSLTPYPLSLNVSTLSPGMYFLRLNSPTGTVVKKFIKE